MPFLLDTHTAYWTFAAPSFLSARVRDILTGNPDEKFVSPISAYELVFKSAIGKLDALPGPFSHLAERSGFSELKLSVTQAELAARLPLSHKDPWDRLLAAQAIESGFALITKDSQIAKLGVQTIW